MRPRQIDQERQSAMTFYLCLGVVALASLLAIVLVERFM
jgi:hypothetical protein